MPGFGTSASHTRDRSGTPRGPLHRLRTPVRFGPPVAALLVFSLLAWLVGVGGPVRRLDERVGRAASGALPVRCAEFLADLGNVEVAVPVLALAAGWAALRARHRGATRWWLPPAGAAAAMVAVPVLVVPTKWLVARPGPPGAGPGGCYPSGHAVTAAVAYGVAALLLAPALRAGVARWLLGTAVVVLNVAVGVGLVVRGYHWPLDVLGGWALVGGGSPLVTAVCTGAGAGRAGRSRRAEDRRAGPGTGP